jgi:outer membrane PBP1 activator LpoA protein
MVQRLYILLVASLLLTGMAYAAPADKSSTNARQKTALKKSPEVLFVEGLDCLKRSDNTCAQLAAAGIPNQSPYSKILLGAIAATQKNFDQAFRLLLPLKVASGLSREASASLHTSLALAYEAQPEELPALEHRTMAETFMAGTADREANHRNIWQLLSIISKEQLIDMRGESQDTTAQGWIDLALAVQQSADPAIGIAEWGKIYPDHPATMKFAPGLAAQLGTISPSPSKQAANGPIALILPLGIEAFYPAADAIERGFMAAQTAAGHASEVKIYATAGDGEKIGGVYAQAVAEGAKYIVGPVTEKEVVAVASSQPTVMTLALNRPESGGKTPNLFAFGLSLEDESHQIARLAKKQGMQNAVIISSQGGLSTLMAKKFSENWIAEGGQVLQQFIVDIGNPAPDIKSAIAAQPLDFIVMCLTAEEARSLRPLLDIAIPTFGFSHIYAGLAADPQNAVLSAIRFVDIPWALRRDNASLAAAAADLPPGEMQRWFALGADAYQLMLILSQQPLTASTLNGLTGKISISADGDIKRELAVARFAADGVIVERMP